MAGAARDGWTRLVRWLRVLLPLTALAILSTVFFVARNLNPDDAIPYARVDVEDRLREPRMTMPDHSALTRDGADLNVTADETRPTGAERRRTSAQTVFGTLKTPDGGLTQLVSDSAVMDARGEVITFTGDVEVTNSAGYVVTTERLAARTDQTEIRSLAPVQAEGPVGRITAEDMSLTQDPARPDDYLLVFKGTVKLVYEPSK